MKLFQNLEIDNTINVGDTVRFIYKHEITYHKLLIVEKNNLHSKHRLDFIQNFTFGTLFNFNYSMKYYRVIDYKGRDCGSWNSCYLRPSRIIITEKKINVI